MSNKRTCPSGRHVLQEDLSYGKACLMGYGRYVLPLDMSYCIVFLKGYVRGHVSWDDMSQGWEGSFLMGVQHYGRTFLVGITGLLQVYHGLMCVYA